MKTLLKYVCLLLMAFSTWVSAANQNPKIGYKAGFNPAPLPPKGHAVKSTHDKKTQQTRQIDHKKQDKKAKDNIQETQQKDKPLLESTGEEY